MNTILALIVQAAGGVITLGGLAVLGLALATPTSARLLAAVGAVVDRRGMVGVGAMALAAVAAGLTLLLLHWLAPVLLLLAAATQQAWRLAQKKRRQDEIERDTTGEAVVRSVRLLFLLAAVAVLVLDGQGAVHWRVGDGIWIAGTVVVLALGLAVGVRRWRP